MKRALLYPALLFLISPLFGANADYSAMFGSDRLKSAESAYEKFGYVSPLVELAKTDGAARKKLDKIVADLKSKSEKSSYARDRLANIYFLAGDRAQFEKIANPDFAKVVFSSPDEIYPKLDAETYSVLTKDNQYVYNTAVSRLCNIGREDIAKKIWDSDGYWNREFQQWNAVSDYSTLKNRGVEGISKKRLIGFLSKFADELNAFAATRMYVLTMNDAQYAKEFEAAKKVLDTLPPDRRASELRSAFDNFGMKELAAEQLEKLYEMGKLNLYEKQSLLSYWLYGNQNVYRDTIPDSFFSSPNRAKAVKLMEEIAPVEAEVSDSTTTVMLICYYAKIGDSEKLSQALKKFLPKIQNQWNLRQIAKRLILGTDGFPKDEKLAQSLLNRLTITERADFYLNLASGAGWCYSDYYIPPKQMQKFLRTSAELGNKDAAKHLLSWFGYFDALEFCDSLKDMAAAENLKACYQAENGDWSSAVESFKKSAQFGGEYAKLTLACCKYEGRGMAVDKAVALSEMEKLVNSLKPYPNSYIYSNAKSQISLLFGEKSEVYGKFLDLCNLAGIADSAYDKYQVLSDYPEAGREVKILELAKSFYSWRKDNFNSSGEFLDTKKAKNKKVNIALDYEYTFSLMSGEDGEKNPEKAFNIIKNNYAYDNLWQFWLAYCYRNGIGTKADSDKADKLLASIDVSDRVPDFAFFKNAPKLPDDALKPLVERYIAGAKTGRMLANAARLYLRGTNGLAPDFARAIALYEKAAALDGSLFENLANAYKDNWVLKDDKKYFENLNRYFDYCKKELSYVPRDAYFDLALCYLNGRGTARDGAKAFAYFEKAAERPYSTKTVPALEALAYCAEKGIGRPSDPAEAAKLRKKAEELMLAQTYPTGAKNAVAIANLYNKGGLEDNPERRLYWLEFSRKNYPSLSICWRLYDFYTKNPKFRDWKKANEFLAEHAKYAPHSPWNLYRRGLSLVVGAGMEKDVSKGVKLLEDAALRYRKEATEFLAYIYGKGIGVARDEKKAEKLLAELLNNRETNYVHLAKKYLDGTNFITDVDRAKFLLKLGADNGNLRAKDKLDNFEKFVAENKK